MHVKRILGVVAIALMLALAATGGFATPALAAPAQGRGQPTQAQHSSSAGPKSVSTATTSCGPGSYGPQCDNTDPFQTNCANNYARAAYTYDYYLGSKWLVQLIYSWDCHTVWARLWLVSGTNKCTSCELTVTRYSGGSTWLNEGCSGCTIYNGAWTNQLYVRCGDVANADVWHPDINSGSWTSNWNALC